MTAPTEETQLEILKQLKKIVKYHKANYTIENDIDKEV